MQAAGVAPLADHLDGSRPAGRRRAPRPARAAEARLITEPTWISSIVMAARPRAVSALASNTACETEHCPLMASSNLTKADRQSHWTSGFGSRFIATGASAYGRKKPPTFTWCRRAGGTFLASYPDGQTSSTVEQSIRKQVSDRECREGDNGHSRFLWGRKVPGPSVRNQWSRSFVFSENLIAPDKVP